MPKTEMPTTEMPTTAPIRYDRETPEIIQAMTRVSAAIGGAGLDRRVYHLVQVRASQINGCAFCLDMHLREARAEGETTERLDRVAVWEHVSCFSEMERAAFAWAEALTILDRKTGYGELRARLREHFSDQQISTLTSLVAMINMWNRMQVSRH